MEKGKNPNQKPTNYIDRQTGGMSAGLFGVMKSISSEIKAEREAVRHQKMMELEEKRIAFENPGAHKETPRSFLEETKKRMDYRAKLGRLETLLLAYVFNADDGKISFKEKRSLKKFFLTLNKRITISAMDEIIELSKTTSTLSDISLFINQQQYSIEELDHVINSLRKICIKNKEYNQIIDRLERSLSDRMGY
ncbi:hypothetical protein KQ51_00819 [Candidatus Izimaplasma bacterium HR1]|jgi:hypothetical protein|uniref:hypothetical protein n=1 Tax=Candidatus Izimoplasma sp. HR1 TaxID=1541959 RepID=UPI0004F80D54|nr:hypothetical protein KQ51_00819 [Candidatus Izimaplasma bacterium HR1]